MAWSNWGAVPPDEKYYMENLITVWEQTVGYAIPFSVNDMLMMANAGLTSQHDIGQFVESRWGGGPGSVSSRFASVLAAAPWALYGLDKDSYAAMTETFGTEYTKITGQQITPQALQQAFQNPRDQSGGLLTASQYAQQLMNDASIQKQFGWVKYGMDFTQWTQQKLQLQTTFGRSINDTEAATLLQYNKAASGANYSAVERAGGGQQQGAPAGVGVGGSLAR